MKPPSRRDCLSATSTASSSSCSSLSLQTTAPTDGALDDGTLVALDLLQHVIQEGSKLAHQANDGQEIDAAAVMALRDALAGAHACLAQPPVQRSRLYQEAVDRRLAIERQKQSRAMLSPVPGSPAPTTAPASKAVQKRAPSTRARSSEPKLRPVTASTLAPPSSAQLERSRSSGPGRDSPRRTRLTSPLVPDDALALTPSFRVRKGSGERLSPSAASGGGSGMWLTATGE